MLGFEREMRTGWKGPCWKHPARGVVGVCAPCLRERLVALDSSEERFADRFANNSSLDSASSSGFLSHVPAADGASRAEGSLVPTVPDQPLQSGVTDTRRSETLSSTHAAGASLRRSVSWSQSKSNAHGPGTLRDDLNLDFDPNSKHVSINYGRNSGQNGENCNRKKSDKVAETSKSSSWLSSLLHWRIRRGKAPPSFSASPQKVSKCKNTKQGLFSSAIKAALGSKQAESDTFGKSVRGWKEESDDMYYTESVNSWMSGPLSQREDLSCGQRQTLGSYLRRSRGTKGYECQPTRRVIPLSGGSEGGATWRFEKSGRYQVDHRESCWAPWATPLRIFSRKSRKAAVALDHDDMPGTAAANSWKLSCDHDLPRPSPAHPATYSAFYRDSGSLSLYSSPVPGNSRSRGGRRHWNSRTELFHSSPYMGNSFWNFYLTPVRPIKSSLKQRL